LSKSVALSTLPNCSIICDIKQEIMSDSFSGKLEKEEMNEK
jgi:hypothetical protein